MKLSLLFLAVTVCALPTLSDPLSYTLTFTGGPFENGVQLNFAPESGSFNYDPTSGFSNFLVTYNGDIFNFTAAANAPTICSSASSCAPGTAAQEFQVLSTYSDWLDQENSSFTYGVSGINTLFLGDYHGQISAQGPGFANFSATSPPAVGTFTLAEAPEPGTFELLSATILAIFGIGMAQRRNAAKQSS